MISEKKGICMDMTVLERQQTKLKWLLQLQNHNYGNQHDALEPCSMPQFQGFFDHTPGSGELVDARRNPEMYVGSSGLARYGDFSLEGDGLIGNKMDSAQAELMSRSLEIDHCLSRTSSFQMGVTDAAKMEEELVTKASGEDVTLKEKIQNNFRRQISNKRKAEFATTEYKDKRIKGESMGNEKSSTENSTGSSKENQNTLTAQKTDYIHVRARRGQATDSHSLAERARREKISKKMKCLQDLVPGCNKITGRAGMLDEIINYVQSLQRQVEFLSMKLAAVSPTTESNFDSFSKKEFPAYFASFPAAALSSTIDSLSQLPLNLRQASIGSETELLKNPHQVVPERTTNSPSFLPEQSLDSSCFSQNQSFWNEDLQALQSMGFHLHQG